MLRVLLISGACAVLASQSFAYEASPSLPGAVPDAIQSAGLVETVSGPVRGVDDGEMLAWLGIPYAVPPIGDLRWMPPQTPETWTTALTANDLPEACAQEPQLGFFATPGGGEDCLYLNIYGDRQAINRARAGAEKLPVFVWIHGGGLHVGQGADHNPRALVKDGRSIVVTLNYRLGVFGFFAHPAIDGEGHPAINYGQMDQTFALQWVQDNIAAFGGDPAKVTIAGESSGGNSVVMQVLTPWAAGLFQNAISMSGGAIMLKSPHFGSVSTQAEAQQLGVGFAEAAGCGETEDAAACLRGLSTDEILLHQAGYQIAQTVIDGDYLPDWPETLFESGDFNHVNLVSGTTLDEGDFFVALPEIDSGRVLDAPFYLDALEAQFGSEIGPRVAAEYPLSDYHNPSKALSATITSYLFVCPSIRLMDLASAHTEVRAYEFADRTAPSYAPPVSFQMGAAHTFEIPYLFPGYHGGASGLPTELNPLQEELAEDMRGWFTGLSDSDEWTDWPRYDPETQGVLQMQLGGSRMLEPGEYAELHHCAFWDEQAVY